MFIIIILKTHLHRKGTDDPVILFMTFWNIIKRSSTGIRSDHPLVKLDIVDTSLVCSSMTSLRNSLVVQESVSACLETFLCLELFCFSLLCFCNVPVAFLLSVQEDLGLGFLLNFLFLESL